MVWPCGEMELFDVSVVIWILKTKSGKNTAISWPLLHTIRLCLFIPHDLSNLKILKHLLLTLCWMNPEND